MNQFHVAIIMDGNGRWAQAKGLPRTAGHRAGADALRRTIEASPELGIDVLTLYAFSSDNWRRPHAEVNALMDLFRFYLKSEVERCAEHAIRLSVIGRRDRLAPDLRAAIAAAEEQTREGRRLHLRIAVDYSARDMIVRAARAAFHFPSIDRHSFSRLLAAACCDSETPAAEPIPDVDLLIRTGGEQRLSDFLLWECSYAELYFTPVFWPDFDALCLRRAVEDFRRRERRFGAAPAAVTA